MDCNPRIPINHVDDVVNAAIGMARRTTSFEAQRARAIIDIFIEQEREKRIEMERRLKKDVVPIFIPNT
jgi:hypothetical protein